MLLENGPNAQVVHIVSWLGRCKLSETPGLGCNRTPYAQMTCTQAHREHNKEGYGLGVAPV